MMKAIERLAVLVLTTCLAIGAAAAAGASTDTRTLASVNGQNITEIMLKVFAISKTGQPLANLSPTVRQALLDELINTALLAQDGSQIKFTESLKAGRELADMRYLSSVDIAHTMQSQKFSDQQVQAEYNQLVAVHVLQQYHLLQILVPDMATGERVRALLAQGMPFGHAAGLYSRDPGSRLKGGDLGWVSASTPAPGLASPAEMGEVMRVASELRIGGISEPFANSAGVHILMLVATETLPLADVKPRVEAVLMQQALLTHTAQLRAAAKIKQFDQP